MSDMSHTQIDDRFLTDWFEYGMREISAYLANQARFDRYLRDHEGSGEQLR